MKQHRGFSLPALAIGLLFLVAAGGLAWVSMGIVAHDRWPIRWLEVNGEFQRVSAEQLRATLSPEVGGSFFTLDMAALEREAKQIAWVDQVIIEKRWPDTVVVSVTEYEPLAHWNRGQLISGQGRAFAVPEADSIQGLPWLNGPPDRLDEILGNWAAFNDLLEPTGLMVRRLLLDQRGAWSLVLDNGTAIQLGRDAAFERLARLMSGWQTLVAQREAPPREVDLRYTNGMAVNWLPLGQEQTGNDS